MRHLLHIVVCFAAAATVALAVRRVDPPWRSINGIGVNPTHPSAGVVGTPHTTDVGAAYSTYDQARAARPSARLISNELFGRNGAGRIDDRVSELTTFWGQFVDHDITLTHSQGSKRTYGRNACPFASRMAGAPAGIPVPPCDPIFDPPSPETGECRGDVTIPFAAPEGIRVNEVTAWVDGSQVYGSTPDAAAALRDPHDRALMATDDANPMLLPPIDQLDPDGRIFSMENAVGIEHGDRLRAAGDVRANENPVLLSLHTLFVREHNRRVAELRRAHGAHQDADFLYQQARAWVIALLQHITYDEYLPALLGPDAIPPYRGMQTDATPGQELAFVSALFRFGHSQIGPNVHIDTGATAYEIPLEETFFRTNMVIDNYGIDAILVGASKHAAQQVDAFVVPALRNLLFNNGSSAAAGPGEGLGGTDLVSLNIERGRHHGLPPYADACEAYGLARPLLFADIGADAETTAILADLYNDDFARVDLIVGALAEPPAPGARVGPLLRASFIDEFTRLRDADGFWWENGRWPAQWQRDVRKETLTDVITRNRDSRSGIDTKMQKHVFSMSAASRVTNAVWWTTCVLMAAATLF